MVEPVAISHPKRPHAEPRLASLWAHARLMSLSVGIIVFVISGLCPTALSARADTATQPQAHTEQEPEEASPRQPARLARARTAMIATNHPAATKAGRAVLEAGGTAIDAAIAAQAVLGLVEPQSSGLGGGGFILYWDAATRRLISYDGRERAPQAAGPGRFLGADGQPMERGAAIRTGLSIGVPGLAALLDHAHKRHGRKPWPSLWQPAIQLADKGFPVSPRLHALLERRKARGFGDAARGYFFDARGNPHPVGHVLPNPDLARTMRAIAEGGAAAFYTGALADELMAGLQSRFTPPSDMARDDLAHYRVIEREPVCAPYRGLKVCSMGPPSSGGIAIGQILGLLAPFDLGTTPLNPRALHLIAEAQKLAYADRNAYIADPGFTALPDGLLAARYLDGRRSALRTFSAQSQAAPGQPDPTRDPSSDATMESRGTTHISVVDADGNALAMTTTIEAGFGAREMVAGFLLNNQLTDFAFFNADRAGRPLANRLAAYKRARSTMSPTLVFGPDGRPIIVTGSPGGTRIILYVIKTLVAVIDWGLDIQTAIALPNFGSRNGPFELEVGDHVPRMIAPLRALGHEVRAQDMTSGLNGIVITPEGLFGGVDPRREGFADGY